MTNKTQKQLKEIEFKRDRTRLFNLLKKYEDHLITGISVQNKDYSVVNCCSIIRNAISEIKLNMGKDNMQWLNLIARDEELLNDPRFDYKNYKERAIERICKRVA